MSGGVEIAQAGKALVITLTRPEAINALSREMIDTITGALGTATRDSSIALVLFEGRGPRGFCAGGDVRAIRDMVLAGRLDEADAYFEAEYAMNRLIATCPKPTAVIAHGATMGGGIGIAGHCRHRFASATTRFAMPETAIGLVPDVGANALLAEVPVRRALPFLLAGVPVGAADGLALSLTDHVIGPDRLDELRNGLLIAAEADDVDAEIGELAGRLATDPGPAAFCALADALPELDTGDTGRLVGQLLAHAGPAWQALIAPLAKRSPTSLEATRLSHLAARRQPGLDHVLAVDLELARLLVRLPDFAEGVRAVLIDKDHAAHWSPSGQMRVSPKSFINSIAALSTPDGPTP